MYLASPLSCNVFGYKCTFVLRDDAVNVTRSRDCQRVRCSSEKLFCPFGKDCFYQHLNNDGTEYVFKNGVGFCMKVCITTPRDVGICRNDSQQDLQVRDIYNYEPQFWGT